MLKKILILFLSLFVVFSICGCSETQNTNDTTMTKAQMQINSKENITQYLKEKYPDLTLEIGAIESNYSGKNMFQSKVTDNDGNTYIVKTRGTLTGKEGIESTYDNIEQKKVEEIILNKLNDIFNVTNITSENFNNKNFASNAFLHDRVDDCTAEEILYQYTHPQRDPDEKYLTITRHTLAYIYTDQEIDLYSLEQDEKDLLSMFAVVFVKFNDNQINEKIKNDYMQVTFYNALNAFSIFAPYVDRAYVYVNEIESFELLKTKTKTDNDIIYSKRGDYIEDISFACDKEYDLNNWNDAINSYEINNNTKLINCKILSPVYTTLDTFDYFVKISNEENKYGYQIFYEKDGKYKIVNILKEIDKNKNNASYEIGEYLFINNESLPSNANWFVVQYEMEVNSDV